MTGTESPDFDRAAEGLHVLQEARQDRATIALLERRLATSEELRTGLVGVIHRYRSALEACGASFISDPCTVQEGASLLASEFRRRMDIASAALNHTATSDLDVPAKVHGDVTEALSASVEYFDNLADVVDGDYGVPEPNREMTLAQLCRDAMERLP